MTGDDALRPVEIASDVFRLEAPFGPGLLVPNAVYLIRGPEPTLIDAGVDGAPTAQLVEPLRALGLGLADVRLLLLTHGHPDHMGGAADLRDASRALHVRCHPADRGWVEDHERSIAETFGSLGDDWRPDEATIADQLAQAGPSVTVDAVLEAGVKVGSDAAIDAEHVPGHTPGSVAYLHGPSGALFTGDALQGYGVSIPTYVTGFPGYADATAYRSSLALIDQLAPSVMATSHHGVFEQAAWPGHVAESVAFVEQLDGLVIAALRDAGRPMRLPEVAATVATHFPDHEHAYQLHLTTRAHLRALVATAQAREDQAGAFSAV